MTSGNWRSFSLVAACVCGLAGAGCWGGPPRDASRDDGAAGEDVPALFEEIQDQVGLHFVHNPGRPGTWFYPEIMIMGAAMFDYDRDGDLDIYLLNCGDPPIPGVRRDPSQAINRLFRQEADGRFVDVTQASGLGDDGYGMGVAVGDVDNDGYPDVYITNYGKDRLFWNDGAGHFEDITESAGVTNERWSSAACFLDYDRDGWLDLYVANYIDHFPERECFGTSGRRDYCGPASFDPTVDQLYRNVTGETGPGSGDGPQAGAGRRVARFEDVTVRAGIAERQGSGLGVMALDFDGDGWQDIYVANDMLPNFLWINQRDGTFSDEALMRGVANDAQGRPQASMGLAVTDLNADQFPDLYVTHMAGEMNALYMSDGPIGYREVSMQHGLAVSMHALTTYGAVFLDIDHDGADDLVTAGGSMKLPDAAVSVPSFDDRDAYWKIFAEHNQIFLNDGDGNFTPRNSRHELFTTRREVSRALCAGDIDGDGDLDLLLGNTAGKARLYRNVAKKSGNWLRVRVIEPRLGGRDAYGARVTVHAAAKFWTRWISPGSSYLCSHDPVAHFGLGKLDRVERVDVRWPDGSNETFPGGPVNQLRVLSHGEGVPQ